MSEALLIKCLECGKSFRAIGSHLVRTHGMTAREYRAAHDLPASYKLAADDLRAAQSELTHEMLASGILVPDPLLASEHAREAGRGHWTAERRAAQSEIARSIPREMIPDGGKRADGRDAVRARETQRARRTRKRGD